MTRTGAAVVVVTLLAVCSVAAQEPKPKFEVASIKRNVMTDEQFFRPAAGGVSREPGMSAAGGRFNALRVTVRSVVIRAFGIEGRYVVGGPAWLNSDTFDISAIANPKATVPEMNAMLQSLLADRFSLRTHIEKRPADVQVLTITRSDGRLGSGLRPTTPDCDAKMRERILNPPTPASVQEYFKGQMDADMAARLNAASKGATSTPPPPCGSMSLRMLDLQADAAILVGTGQPMSALVDQISRELKAPVIDRTGLKGWFDISMEYSRALSASPTAASAVGRDLRGAVEKHLGLRLAKQRVPVDVLVIDSVQRPTEN
jgi:uncharacterized protein (TIGR03435 family)